MLMFIMAYIARGENKETKNKGPCKVCKYSMNV